MATATQQLPKMRYMAAAGEAWYEWRKRGNEPTREKAISEVEGVVGRIKAFDPMLAKNNKDGSLNDSLSFLYWDIHENGQRALDYSEQTAFLKNLLYQASQIVSGMYTEKAKMKIGGQTVSIPVRSHPFNATGSKNHTDLSLEDREDVADDFIKYAKIALVRWHAIKGDGAVQWSYIRKVLVRLVRELRAEWENMQ